VRELFAQPCTIVAGIKEAGAATILVELLEGAHPDLILHAYFHHSAASVLAQVPGCIAVPDDFNFNPVDFIAAHKPDIFLVGASAGWSIEKFMYAIAKNNNIPIHAFMDNYMNPWQRFADERSAKPWVYVPDCIYAISNEMAEELVGYGYDRSMTKVIQHPILESLAKKPLSNLPAFKASIGVKEKTHLLTLAVETGMPDSDLWHWDNNSSQIDTDIENILKFLLDFAVLSNKQDSESVIILIKGHPSDIKSFDHLLDKYPSNIYRHITNVDKVVVLDASEAVIGIGSMLLCESAIRKRPTYSYKVRHAVMYPNLPSFPCLQSISSLDALKSALESVCQ
jgi:hypothetical protein